MNIKKLLLTIILFSSQSAIYGQIKSTTTVKKSPIKNVEYDSTKNFMGEDMYAYIGQTLYLKGDHRKEAYRGFVLNYIDGSENDNTYLPSNSNGYSIVRGSDYEAMANKYFRVLDVIPHPKQDERSYYENKYFLKLRDLKNRKNLYYEYDASSYYSFPFITVGYYEKSNASCKGQKYILNRLHSSTFFHTPSISRKKQVDVLTGDEVTSSIGDVWECQGITIWEDNDHDLAYELKNDKGQIILVSYNINEPSHGIYTIEERDYYKEKFGAESFNLVLSGIIKVGMTEEMVTFSIGPPKSINKSETGNLSYDQWVYSSERYLYFTNGKLDTIQGDWN